MLRHSRFLVGCCGAAFAIVSFLIGLEVSATTAAPSLDKSTPVVNRMLKSDRLPLVPSQNRNAVNGPVEIKTPPAPAKPRLLDGCEPMISSIGQSPLAQVPGRCLS
jgi:hypothetical protein